MNPRIAFVITDERSLASHLPAIVHHQTEESRISIFLFSPEATDETNNWIVQLVSIGLDVVMFDRTSDLIRLTTDFAVVFCDSLANSGYDVVSVLAADQLVSGRDKPIMASLVTEGVFAASVRTLSIPDPITFRTMVELSRKLLIPLPTCTVNYTIVDVKAISDITQRFFPNQEYMELLSPERPDPVWLGNIALSVLRNYYLFADLVAIGGGWLADVFQRDKLRTDQTDVFFFWNEQDTHWSFDRPGIYFWIESPAYSPFVFLSKPDDLDILNIPLVVEAGNFSTHWIAGRSNWTFCMLEVSEADVELLQSIVIGQPLAAFIQKNSPLPVANYDFVVTADEQINQEPIDRSLMRVSIDLDKPVPQSVE